MSVHHESHGNLISVSSNIGSYHILQARAACHFQDITCHSPLNQTSELSFIQVLQRLLDGRQSTFLELYKQRKCHWRQRMISLRKSKWISRISLRKCFSFLILGPSPMQMSTAKKRIRVSTYKARHRGLQVGNVGLTLPDRQRSRWTPGRRHPAQGQGADIFGLHSTCRVSGKLDNHTSLI